MQLRRSPSRDPIKLLELYKFPMSSTSPVARSSSRIQEITGADGLYGAAMAAPALPVVRRARSRSNNDSSCGNNEAVLIMFNDPSIEKDYRSYASSKCRRLVLSSLCMSILVTLLHGMKADYSSFPAKVLRSQVVVGVTGSLACLYSLLGGGDFGTVVRSPGVVFFRVLAHVPVLCLPPMLYTGLKTPSTKFGVYMVGPRST
jgi:hypothetical protein